METAVELRSAFRALPKADREAHSAYCIRIWRALSWLERAENLDAADIEGRFISAWISFNALYGQLDPDRRAYGDREAWSIFLSHIWRIDDREQIKRVMQRRRMWVLHLIEDKYLFQRFWIEGNAVAKMVQQETRDANVWFGGPKTFKILQMLFDRLYVLRNQLLHGASTKGSKLNRRPLREAGNLLVELLAAMISVMIARGVHEDWGKLCFPPDGPEFGQK